MVTKKIIVHQKQGCFLTSWELVNKGLNLSPRWVCGGVILLAIFSRAMADQPWPRHAVDDTSQGADGVRLADFNGDGRPDIATGWEEGGLVRLYLHPGQNDVKKPWPQVTVGRVKSPEDAVPVDLDGDGAMDIATCCEGRTRTIYVHWSPKDRSKLLEPDAWKTEPFPQTAGKRLWMFALPLEVDGARGIDLVVGSKGKPGGVAALVSPADPRDLKSWQLHDFAEMGWIMSLQTHDCDGDEDLDVLISNRKSPGRGVFWLLNPASNAKGPRESIEQWKLQRIAAADRELMFLGRGDVTGDGRPDVVVAVKGRGLALLEGPKSPDDQGEDTHLWPEREIALPKDIGTGKGIAIGDVDLDGCADIVFSCENAGGEKSGVRWMSRDGKSERYSDHEISGSEGIKFDRIELLDLDGDGDLDVLTCEERAGLGVIWYENPAK